MSPKHDRLILAIRRMCVIAFALGASIASTGCSLAEALAGGFFSGISDAVAQTLTAILLELTMIS